jgi:hypothetical protein
MQHTKQLSHILHQTSLIHEKIIVSGELVRIWKEAVVAYFKVPNLHLSEGAEENHESSP